MTTKTEGKYTQSIQTNRCLCVCVLVGWLAGWLVVWLVTLERWAKSEGFFKGERIEMGESF